MLLEAVRHDPILRGAAFLGYVDSVDVAHVIDHLIFPREAVLWATSMAPLYQTVDQLEGVTTVNYFNVPLQISLAGEEYVATGTGLPAAIPGVTTKICQPEQRAAP